VLCEIFIFSFVFFFPLFFLLFSEGISSGSCVCVSVYGGKYYEKVEMAGDTFRVFFFSKV
jgi:hypothetical protein